MRTSIFATGLCLLLGASAQAQINLVRVTNCAVDGAFPATACSIPASGSGNLLVVGWTGASGTAAAVIASITDNVGNAYLEAGPAKAVDGNASVNDMADVWYAKNSLPGATVLTITPNPSGTLGTVVVWEFSGVDTIAPLDQTAVLNSQAATTTTVGASVNASADELVVSIANLQTHTTGIVSGNPFMSDSAASGNGWAHLITTSAGTYGAQWNSTLGSYCAVTTSFKASSSGGVAANACDLNNDGVVNVVDVQLAVNMDLGLLTCTADVAGLGICSPAVVQTVVNAALGGACVTSNPHSVSLSWTASTSTTVAGYNVYRGTTSGGPYTRLNASLVGVTSYVDSTVVAGQTYYYVSTAVDSSSDESAYSNQVLAQVPTP